MFLEILQMWKGGMSFHGGLLGLIFAAYLFARRGNIRILMLFDIISAVGPIGLFFGRIANFINGELWGRTTDMPWGIVFPHGGPLPRHPSQLYEAGLEGLVLTGLAAVLIIRYQALMQPGKIFGTFLAGYGISMFRRPSRKIRHTMVILKSIPRKTNTLLHYRYMR